MKTKSGCRLLTVFLVGCVLHAAASAPAKGSAVTDGIDWLIANQDESGLWGVDKETPFRDATVVLEVLGLLEADSSAVQEGLAAIMQVEPQSSDYMSRKISAAAVGLDTAPVIAALAAVLAEMQNDDGGWGYHGGYGSNALDAALALKALKTASYPDAGTFSLGVTYLTTAQNADGGWSFVAGDSSRVLYTAQAVVALTRLEDEFDVSDEIQDAVAWLRLQARPDGGFGSGSASNPYETGLALAAMVRGGWSGSEVTAAQAYLEGSQLPDGSWNTDAYSTALAVYGLNHVGPDLAVFGSEIVLSNPAPSDSELVQVSATVRNLGILDATDVLAQVFDGDPEEGGAQIGADQLIGLLAAGAGSDIQVEWNTLGLGGDHVLYVVVDPAQSIQEPEELNNTATKHVHVNFAADLLIGPDGIVFDPAEPDSTEAVVIQTTVKNAGETTATNVSLQVWDGNPATDGVPLLNPPYNIPSIAPGSQFTLNLNMGNYFDSAGDYPIFACADVDSVIREIDELNNCNYGILHVGQIHRAYEVKAGLNLLGLPVVPFEPKTSYTMIPEIPNASEIDGWDRHTQSWLSTVALPGDVTLGDDFPIALQDGFFARVTADYSVEFVGRRVEEHPCTDLELGLNMVSVPNEDACYTAFTLIDDIEGGEEAHAWDVEQQLWVSAIKIGEGEFSGEDFPVTPGNGYFVKTGTAGEWCTHACDTTVTELPDLLVTPDDIWIDPNPSTAGEPVVIAVNIHNIGTATAYTPRLDIWVGDPDEGGTQLLSGYLPIDIPPGESSGYWGNEFGVFNTPGVYDIFGIADFYDEIVELDETNNRASRQLTVLPAAPGAVLAAGLASSQPEAKGRPAVLRLMREADRPDATLRNPQRSLVRSPDALKGPVSAEEVSEIAGVRVSNHSSSSVTVSWTTDVAAGGCVRYGTTRSMGSLACAPSGAVGQVHSVILTGLTSETSYYFEITSGGLTENNKGALYDFRTTRAGAGIPGLLYGRLVDADTDAAIGDALLSVTLGRGDVVSHPVTAHTDAEGVWVVNLGNFKDPESDDIFVHAPDDVIAFEFLADHRRVAADTLLLGNSTPQDCGTTKIAAAEPGGAPVVPSHYYLAANFPNPFQASTTIKFGLPVDGEVTLHIYDVAGRRVATILDGRLKAGSYAETWDGRNATGHVVSSGLYFYRLRSGEFEQVRKMFLVR